MKIHQLNADKLYHSENNIWTLVPSSSNFQSNHSTLKTQSLSSLLSEEDLLLMSDIERLVFVNYSNDYFTFTNRKEVSQYFETDGNLVNLELLNWSFDTDAINICLINFEGTPVILPYRSETSIQIKYDNEFISLQSDLIDLIYKISELKYLRHEFTNHYRQTLYHIKYTHVGDLARYLTKMFCKLHQLQEDWDIRQGSYYAYAIWSQVQFFLVGDIVISGKNFDLLERLYEGVDRMIRKLTGRIYGTTVLLNGTTKFKPIYLRR